MSEEDFGKLFQDFVRRKKLDPETAASLLQKILDILFPESCNQRQEDG